MGSACSSDSKTVDGGAIKTVSSASPSSKAKAKGRSNGTAGTNTATIIRNADGDGDGWSSASSNSGDDGSSNGEPSRPPTPFSRPLTGRVAARPRTTTIFERAADARKANTNSGGSTGSQLQKNRSSGSLLTADNAAAVATSSNAAAAHRGGGDETMPPPLSARKVSQKMADQEEIEKLKEFLREKGL